jgi:4-amino-4-deoxy-L-arabinose transferase-like glycosyltransferase
LLSTPVFLGLSVIDEKDAPIAAGMTLLSCGTALLLWRLFEKDHGSGDLDWMEKPGAANAVAAFMVFLGTTIAFGTRVGTAALIGVECAIVGLLFLLALPRGIARVATAICALLLSVGAGVFVAIAINPLARKAPIQWMMEGILYAVTPATQGLMVYGRMINSGALPWWYIPSMVVVEYSATFLALVALGGVAVILRWRRGLPIQEAYPWAPFVIQGFVFPLCIIASGAVLHDRLRHLVFVIPPWAMLAAFGLYYCVDAVRANKRRTAVLLAVLGPLFLLVNFSNTLIWYPYQYVYMSEFARLLPQYSFDNEPLGLSIHEAVARMRRLGIKQFYAGPAPTYEAYGTGTRAGVADGSDVAIELLHPNHPHVYPVPGGGTYYAHTRPSWGYKGLPAFCRKLFTIERQGFILGEGGTC